MEPNKTGTNSNESNNASNVSAVKQLTGTVADRIGGGFLKFTIAIVLIVGVCASLTWFISSRVSAGEQPDAKVPTVYSVQVAPTPIPTPARIGYTSIGDASPNCEAGESVIQLWRNGEVVGFACNLDMDAAREAATGVQLVLPKVTDNDNGR
jgi:hypothetical protein